MVKAIAWKDTYCHTKERIVLTQTELTLPGLEMLGKHTIKNAIAPIALHYHKNCFEFTIVTKGMITFSVNDSEYTLQGGDIFITRPNEPHSTNAMPIPLCELIWFQLEVSNPEHLLLLNSNASSELAARLSALDGYVFHPQSHRVASLANDAFHFSRQEGKIALTASMLTLLLELILDTDRASTTSCTEDIRCAVDYIRQHLTETVALNTLASMCNLTLSAFKQKFTRQMGTSPRNYINQQKISLAKQLLLSGYSVTETAMALGFNSSNYFSTVFKKYNYDSPSDFTAKHPS